MLTVASAGLTIAIERLEQKEYPYAFSDRANHPKAQTELDELLTQKFCGSVLLPEHPKSWRFGRLATTSGNPDEWVEFQHPTAMPPDKSVKSVITHLRNSLAHGSIHTKGDPISEIIFVASVHYHSADFNYMMVSPDDFHNLLLRWFRFLKKLKF